MWLWCISLRGYDQMRADGLVTSEILKRSCKMLSRPCFFLFTVSVPASWSFFSWACDDVSSRNEMLWMGGGATKGPQKELVESSSRVQTEWGTESLSLWLEMKSASESPGLWSVACQNHNYSSYFKIAVITGPVSLLRINLTKITLLKIHLSCTCSLWS